MYSKLSFYAAWVLFGLSALSSPLPAPGKDDGATVLALSATPTDKFLPVETVALPQPKSLSLEKRPLLESVVEIVPVQDKSKEKEIDDVAAIRTGQMRFGFEVETIIKMSKAGGSEPAKELRKALKVSHQKYLGTDTSDSRLEEKRATEYASATTTIIRFLLEEWKTFRPTQRQIEQNSWLSAAEGIMQKFPKHKKDFIQHDLLDGYKKDRPEGSTESWTITYDGTVKPIQQEYEFAFEFVSPIISIGMNSLQYVSGRYPVELFFTFLTEHCGFEIVKSESCSTHVHVSPVGKKTEWTEERVKRVAAASVFFEPAIRSLLPKDRWVNYHALEYRDPKYHGHWAVKGFGESDKGVADTKEAALGVIRKILSKESLTHVRNYMNPSVNDGNNPNSVLTSRTWGWNFLNLIVAEGMDGKGTIEFRRGGQSLDASEAMAVIELVLGFSLASCVHFPKDLKTSFDLKSSSLRRFIYDIPKQYIFSAKTAGGYELNFRLPELERKFTSLTSSFDPTKMELDYASAHKAHDETHAEPENPLEWLDGVDLDGMTVEEYLEMQRAAMDRHQ